VAFSLGFLAGAEIGGVVALVPAFSSITLRQSRVAVGFVPTLLASPIMGKTGPRLAQLPIPFLRDLPVLVMLLFRQELMTCASFLLIVAAWFFIITTRPGLMLHAVPPASLGTPSEKE